MRDESATDLVSFLKSLPRGLKINYVKNRETPRQESVVSKAPFSLDQFIQVINETETPAESIAVFNRFWPDTAEETAERDRYQDWTTGVWTEEAYLLDRPNGHHMVLDVQLLCDRARVSYPGLDEAVMACVGESLGEEVLRAWGRIKVYRLPNYRFAVPVPVPGPERYFDLVGRLKIRLDCQSISVRNTRKEVRIPAIPFRSSLASSLDGALAALS